MSNIFEERDADLVRIGEYDYRYSLHRIWDRSKPLVMFIGLNPSTANKNEDDNTIKRVRLIAAYNGFGGFYMVNLFAVVSPYPHILNVCPDPHQGNDGKIEAIAKECQEIIFAWGDFKTARERSFEIIKMFPDAKALFINKNGSPKHPLYCRQDTTFVPFSNSFLHKSLIAKPTSHE